MIFWRQIQQKVNLMAEQPNPLSFRLTQIYGKAANPVYLIAYILKFYTTSVCIKISTSIP